MAPTSTSFFFNYLDKTTFRDEYFELQGDAFQGTDGSLILTRRNALNSAGRVLYSPSIKFADTHGRQLIFDTIITFKFSQNSNDATPADGITFFIAPVGNVIPENHLGAGLGVFDAQGNGPQIFAVEFDTFLNDFEERLGGPHIGIDVCSWNSAAWTRANISGKEVTAIIRYRGGKVTVDAVTDAETFRVSYNVDLSQYLNQNVQVGVSASTGTKTEDHFLYSWSFASVLE